MSICLGIAVIMGLSENGGWIFNEYYLGKRKHLKEIEERVSALETFSYYDTGKGLSFSAPERFYHGFVLGLLVDMRMQYQILSNRESGFGRYDVMLIPKKENLNAYVLEFKVYDQEEEKDLEETVKSGLAQIKDKNYDADLLAKGISKDRIFHYCFAFEGKKIFICIECIGSNQSTTNFREFLM